MSARRIPRQRRSVSGLFWSLKNGGRHIPYESGLELDYCTLLEFEEAVASFESQPVAVEYRRPSGRLCRGFPDFLVTYQPDARRATELVDVKYREELRERWAHLKPVFEQLAGMLEIAGGCFVCERKTRFVHRFSLMRSTCCDFSETDRIKGTRLD